MVRGLVGALVALFLNPVTAFAQSEPQSRYDDVIARLARTHGVPENFVHRVVKRESRYNPGLVHRQCFGLMQIKHATARSMGYAGSPRGLLDPEVNLTYGVPYLANAYRLADGDADRAVKLYSGGYYYVAKRRKVQGELRTAASPEILPDPPAPAPEPPPGGFSGLLSFLAGPAPATPDPGK